MSAMGGRIRPSWPTGRSGAVPDVNQYNRYSGFRPQGRPLGLDTFRPSGTYRPDSLLTRGFIRGYIDTFFLTSGPRACARARVHVRVRRMERINVSWGPCTWRKAWSEGELYRIRSSFRMYPRTYPRLPSGRKGLVSGHIQVDTFALTPAIAPCPCSAQPCHPTTTRVIQAAPRRLRRSRHRPDRPATGPALARSPGAVSLWAGSSHPRSVPAAP